MRFGFGVVLFLLVAAVSAKAADVTWSGGGDGADWHAGANWGGSVPGSSDNAIIDLAGADIDFAGTETIEQLHMGNASGSQTLDIHSGTLKLIGGTGTNSAVGRENNALSVVNQYGGSVIQTNGGALYVGGDPIGNRNSTGIWNMVSGSLSVKDLQLGHKGQSGAKALFDQAGGTVTVFNMLLMGDGSSGVNEYVVSNGVLVTLASDNTYYGGTGLQIGVNQASSFYQYGGIVSNAGKTIIGNWHPRDNSYTISGGYFYSDLGMLMGRGASSAYFNQAGGVSTIADSINLNLNANNPGIGAITFSGGSFSVQGNLTLDANNTGRVDVVGSACTNIYFSGNFNLNSSATRLRALADDGGVSMIKIGYNADLTGTQFELGVTDASVGVSSGDHWTLLRAPDNKTLTTNSITVTNLDSPTFEFALSGETSDGYHKLIVTCTQAPQRGTVVMIK